MELEIIKQKLQGVLDKKLYINKDIITDDNGSFKIKCNKDGSFTANNKFVYEDSSVLIQNFMNLNSDNQDEKYKAYVELLGYDKRLLGDYGNRIELVKRDDSKYLNLLIDDESVWVRCRVGEVAVLEKREDLFEKLMNDSKPYVRATVASSGYKIDMFMNDESEDVRIEVAKAAHELDREDLLKNLVSDKSSKVRLIVAKYGYGLDKLINDEDESVREAVAEQGYGLDILAKDGDYYVAKAVYRKACELNKTDVLEILANSGISRIRESVAYRGIALDVLVNDQDSDVRAEVAWKAGEINRVDLLEKLINDKDSKVRRYIINSAIKLDKKDLVEKFINDPDGDIKRKARAYFGTAEYNSYKISNKKDFFKLYKENEEFKNDFNKFLEAFKADVSDGESVHFEAYISEDLYEDYRSLLIEILDIRPLFKNTIFDGEEFINFCDEIGFYNLTFINDAINVIKESAAINNISLRNSNDPLKLFDEYARKIQRILNGDDEDDEDNYE